MPEKAMQLTQSNVSALISRKILQSMLCSRVIWSRPFFESFSAKVLRLTAHVVFAFEQF